MLLFVCSNPTSLSYSLSFFTFDHLFSDNTEVAATIFTNKVSLGAKKIMNFKKTTDFSFTVFYK